MNRTRQRTVVVVWSVAALALMLFSCGKTPEKTVKAPTRAPKELPRLFRALPESTILALALTDLDKWRSDLKQTGLHDMWDDPTLQIWREQSWPKLKKIFAEKTGITVSEIDDLIHGDVLLVMGLVDGPEPDDAKPRVGILMRTTTNRAQVEAFLQNILNRLEPNKPAIKWEDDVLILAQDSLLADELAANLKTDKAPLEGRKGYEALKRDYEPGGFLHLWIHVDQIIQLARADMPDGSNAEALITQLGMDNFAAAYFSSSIYKKGFRSSLWLRFDGARKGIFTFAGANGASKAIRLVPADAGAFFSLRHAGVDTIIRTIRAIALAAPEFTEEQWRMGMDAANTNLEIDVEKDLPRLIGEELAFAVLGSTSGGPNVCLYVESDDPSGLIEQIGLWLRKGQIQPQDAEYEGTSYHFFNIPQLPLPVQVSYGRVGDFVVASTQQEGVRQAIEARKSKKSLTDDPTYTMALAEVGKPGWGLLYGKGPAQPPASATMMIPMVLPGINESLGTDLVPADIPNLQTLFKYQGPSVSINRIYTDALEWQGYASSGLPLSLPEMPAVGIGVAIAIPGFMRAREVSRATSCQENLIRIEGAVDQWAVEYDKKDGDQVSVKDLVGPTLYLKKTPRCRGGGDYGTTFTVGETPKCDYVPPAWFDVQGNKYRHIAPDAAF